jgi:hypothetical protein
VEGALSRVIPDSHGGITYEFAINTPTFEALVAGVKWWRVNTPSETRNYMRYQLAGRSPEY